MAGRTCHNCVYSICDPEQWLRWLWQGQSIVPQCANHPWWPGQLHEVSGVPCRNYRPKPAEPQSDIRWISLGDGRYAYVDAADYEWLRQWTWHAYDDGYPARYEKRKKVFMHRQIMQPPRGKVVDHIDGNKANNCRSNLRVCSHRENMHNMRKHSDSSSRFKGVGYLKRRRQWYARIWCMGEWTWLGYFTEEAEAARAYDRKAVELFGEYARLNFPEEWPPERRAQVQAQRQEGSRKTRGPKKAASKKGRRAAAGKKSRPGRRPNRESHNAASPARRPRKSERDRAERNERRRKNGGDAL
jgi:hypothetical protein